MARGLRETKKEQLEKRLYDTALDLFREKGYEAASIREITAKAQVAKGTFFNYFPTKEHVLAAWYRRISDSAFERCADKQFATAREAVTTLMRESIILATDEPDLLKAKSRIAPGVGLISSEEVAQDDEFKAFCLEYLRLDKEKGLLQGTLDETYFANLILTVVTGNSRRWFYEGGFDLADSVEKDLNFLFDAVTRESEHVG